MALNSKHRIKRLKTKSQRYRNTKNQNAEILKSSFTKRIGRKCRFVLNKVMATRKEWIKHIFVAPLIKSLQRLAEVQGVMHKVRTLEWGMDGPAKSALVHMGGRGEVLL